MTEDSRESTYGKSTHDSAWPIGFFAIFAYIVRVVAGIIRSKFLRYIRNHLDVYNGLHKKCHFFFRRAYLLHSVSVRGGGDKKKNDAIPSYLFEF